MGINKFSDFLKLISSFEVYYIPGFSENSFINMPKKDL